MKKEPNTESINLDETTKKNFLKANNLDIYSSFSYIALETLVNTLIKTEINYYKNCEASDALKETKGEIFSFTLSFGEIILDRSITKFNSPLYNVIKNAAVSKKSLSSLETMLFEILSNRFNTSKCFEIINQFTNNSIDSKILKTIVETAIDELNEEFSESFVFKSDILNIIELRQFYKGLVKNKEKIYLITGLIEGNTIEFFRYLVNPEDTLDNWNRIFKKLKYPNKLNNLKLTMLTLDASNNLINASDSNFCRTLRKTNEDEDKQRKLNDYKRSRLSLNESLLVKIRMTLWTKTFACVEKMLSEVLKNEEKEYFSNIKEDQTSLNSKKQVKNSKGSIVWNSTLKEITFKVNEIDNKPFQTKLFDENLASHINLEHLLITCLTNDIDLKTITKLVTTKYKNVYSKEFLLSFIKTIKSNINKRWENNSSKHNFKILYVTNLLIRFNESLNIKETMIICYKLNPIYAFVGVTSNDEIVPLGIYGGYKPLNQNTLLNIFNEFKNEKHYFFEHFILDHVPETIEEPLWNVYPNLKHFN